MDEFVEKKREELKQKNEDCDCDILEKICQVIISLLMSQNLSPIAFYYQILQQILKKCE